MLWISELSEASFYLVFILIAAAEGLNEIITQFLLVLLKEAVPH